MYNQILFNMKRIFSFALLLTLVSFALKAQVFNTASTLSPMKFNIGIEPAVLTYGDNELYLFVNGGMGLVKGADLNVRLGLGDENYFGADVEFKLNKYLSISGGAHNFYDFGLDGTGLVTFPIGPAKIYSGLDLDIVFAENETYLPLWVPIGLEFALKKKMAFIFEAEIAATDDATYHIIGGGLNFYF